MIQLLSECCPVSVSYNVGGNTVPASALENVNALSPNFLRRRGVVQLLVSVDTDHPTMLARYLEWDIAHCMYDVHYQTTLLLYALAVRTNMSIPRRYEFN